jgi:hypothetical protein
VCWLWSRLLSPDIRRTLCASRCFFAIHWIHCNRFFVVVVHICCFVGTAVRMLADEKPFQTVIARYHRRRRTLSIVVFLKKIIVFSIVVFDKQRLQEICGQF